MGGLYVLISLIIPAVLLAYPAIVKHLVFLNSGNSIDFLSIVGKCSISSQNSHEFNTSGNIRS